LSAFPHFPSSPRDFRCPRRRRPPRRARRDAASATEQQPLPLAAFCAPFMPPPRRFILSCRVLRFAASRRSVYAPAAPMVMPIRRHTSVVAPLSLFFLSTRRRLRTRHGAAVSPSIFLTFFDALHAARRCFAR